MASEERLACDQDCYAGGTDVLLCAEEDERVGGWRGGAGRGSRASGSACLPGGSSASCSGGRRLTYVDGPREDVGRTVRYDGYVFAVVVWELMDGQARRGELDPVHRLVVAVVQHGALRDAWRGGVSLSATWCSRVPTPRRALLPRSQGSTPTPQSGRFAQTCHPSSSNQLLL